MERRKSSTVLVVAIVCVAAAVPLLLVCVVCGFSGAAGWAMERDAPTNEATALLTDIREGDYTAARARMCRSYLESRDSAAFERDVAAHPALLTSSGATIRETARNNGRATISGELQVPSGNASVRVMMTHERGARWCVDGIALDDGVLGSETTP